MSERARETGRGYVLGAAAAAAVLLALNVLFYIWYYSGMQLYYRDIGYGANRVLFMLIVWLIVAAAAALILTRANARRMMRLAIPVYAVVLLVVLYAIITGGVGKRWLRVYSVNLYAPAFLYLSLPFTAWAVSRYRRLYRTYPVLVVLGAVGVPVLLAALTSVSAGFMLILTFFLLAIRLVRDRRLSAVWIVLLLAGCVLAAVLLFTIPNARDQVFRRFAVFFSLGQNDPQGDGWTYSNLIAALRGTPLFGSSAYTVDMGEGRTIPAFLFLAREGTEYLPAALALRFGWASLLLPAAAVFSLIFCLFRLSRLAANSFSRYLSFSVGALFLVRLVLGTISCFALYLSGCWLPFTGGLNSVAVDILLLIAALAVSRKEEDLSDLLDRELPPERFLSFLSEDLQKELTLKERLLRLIRAEDEEDDWDDCFFDQDEDEFDFGGTDFREILKRLRNRDPEDAEDPVRTETEEKLSADVARLRQQIDLLQRDIDDLKQDNAALRELNRNWADLLASRIARKKAARTKVFISYNHEDLSMAELLCSRLEARGLRCWYADRDVLAGDYAEHITDALSETKIFIVLLTEAANRSDHVFSEVNLAFGMKDAGLILMPLILEGTKPRGKLEYFLCSAHQTFFTTWRLEAQFEEFAGKVAQVAGG